MIEEKTYEEFVKLPLEERAKIVLKTSHEGSKMKGRGSFIPIVEAWNYLRENKYIILTGGPPKSGAKYGITGEGLIFIDS